MSPLMTPEEAAPLVGLAAQTLKNRAKARTIQHTRPAGTNVIKFSVADIEAILAASVVKPTKPTLRVSSRRKAA